MALPIEEGSILEGPGGCQRRRKERRDLTRWQRKQGEGVVSRANEGGVPGRCSIVAENDP